MSHPSDDHIRVMIQDAADAFFELPVRINERLFQVLELTDDPNCQGAPSSLGLLASALRFLPGIANELQEVGIALQPENYPSMPVFPVKSPNPDDWFTQFESWFWQATRDSLVLDQIQARSSVGVLDTIRSCLQSRYLDEIHYDDITPNDLVAFLIEKAGISRPKIAYSFEWNEIDAFCESLDSRLSSLSEVDSDCGDQQFVLYHDGKGIRVRPFGVWGAYRLQEAPLRDGNLWIARGNVLQPQNYYAYDELGLLEDLINSDAQEREFQKFFETYPKYLTALGDYKKLHSQLVLHEEDGSRLIPDFFLESYTSDFCDICDLKRSTHDIVRNQHNRIRFKDSIQEAVAQLNHYRDWFEDPSNRSNFRTRYGLDAYRPKVVVIIGRRNSFADEIERIKLESGLPPWVSLRTYDDVVEKARQWLSIAAI